MSKHSQRKKERKRLNRLNQQQRLHLSLLQEREHRRSWLWLTKLLREAQPEPHVEYYFDKDVCLVACQA